VNTDNDYGKYFIVDGKHVGDYEGMYRDCQDPWNIEELGFRLDMKAALLLVDLLPFKALSVLDAGAGAGLLSLELVNLLAKTRPGSTFTLSDISLAALDRAKNRIAGSYPNFSGPNGETISFIPFDLRKVDAPECPWPDDSFDLIFLGQVLWGLVENVDGLFPGLKRKIKKGGHLIMSQHFPEPQNQTYAKDLDCRLVAKLAGLAGFNLMRTLETDRMTNHHWAALWSCD
jgi:SAM-dependent methyltransferase